MTGDETEHAGAQREASARPSGKGRQDEGDPKSSGGGVERGTHEGARRSQARDTNGPDEWLRDVQYPADPGRLEEAARRNRAPQEVLAGIRSLPQRTYPDMADVRRTWGDDPAAGQTSTRPSGTRHG